MVKKTNYDAIKNMSVGEMAAVFYMFLKPIMTAFGMSEEQKNNMRESIMSFLTAEIKSSDKK